MYYTDTSSMDFNDHRIITLIKSRIYKLNIKFYLIFICDFVKYNT